MTHITVNSGSSVSIISASAVNIGSDSYRSHLDHFDPVILNPPNKIYLLGLYPLLHATEHLDPFQTCPLLIPLSQYHSFWVSIKISTFINFVRFYAFVPGGFLLISSNRTLKKLSTMKALNPYP